MVVIIVFQKEAGQRRMLLSSVGSRFIFGDGNDVSCSGSGVLHIQTEDPD